MNDIVRPAHARSCPPFTEKIMPETAENIAAEDAPVTGATEKQAQPISDSPPAGLAVLNDEIEISVDRRLPQYDQGPVPAYAARARNADKGRQDQIAYLCDNALVPRLRNAGTVAGINNVSMARLVASGVVYWPPSGGQRYCFVYENNLGKPIVSSLSQGGLAWRQDQVMKAVLVPLISVLSDLRDTDLSHGNIRPTNIFDGGVSVVERVILGDCLATPYGYTQPVTYEPIARAMADPISRGRGTIADDLYALGATLAFILRHKDPMEGMSDAQIIQEKLEQGSYAALTGKDRFTGAILELLRGLLYDDEGQRWTLDDVLRWMDGNRLSPKQAARKAKAGRPFTFAHEKYFLPESLAMDLPKNQAEAVQVVENGTLEQWIERSLESKPMLMRYQQAVNTAQEDGQAAGYADRLTSRVALALDPDGPIRFRNMRFHPEGLPFAMAETVAKRGNMAVYSDIIVQQMMLFWANNHFNFRGDIGSIVSRYDGCRSFLRQKMLGYGMERCLYFLCPEAPCMSPELKNYYVRNPEDLMMAFEHMATRAGRPHMFIDRHIAAFLSIKDRQSIDPFLHELGAPEFHKRVLANIKVVAAIQKRSKLGSFPGISSWIVDILKPAIARFHDRELRTSLKEKIEKMAKAGDLNKIAGLLDNSAMRQEDWNNFKLAMREYADLRQELADVTRKLEDPRGFSREIGQEYAAIASSIVAGIIILIVGFLYFSKAGIF